MVTKIINITESAYIALTRNKRFGESYSDVILRITGKEKKNVGDFLKTIDPAVRLEIADAVISAKRDLDQIKLRKLSL